MQAHTEGIWRSDALLLALSVAPHRTAGKENLLPTDVQFMVV